MTHTHTQELVVPSTTHKEWWCPSFSGSPVYTYMKEMIRRGASENSVMHSMLMTCCTCAPLSIVVPTGLGVHVICEQLLRHFFYFHNVWPDLPIIYWWIWLLTITYFFGLITYDQYFIKSHQRKSKYMYCENITFMHRLQGSSLTFWPFAYYS